jgi:hypothetical protein
LHYHLFVVQHNAGVSNQGIGLGHNRFIESRLFDAKAIGFGRLKDVRGMSGVVGRKANLGVAWLLKDNLSA